MLATNAVVILSVTHFLRQAKTFLFRIGSIVYCNWIVMMGKG